jgi:hypothetical protein
MQGWDARLTAGLVGASGGWGCMSSNSWPVTGTGLGSCWHGPGLSRQPQQVTPQKDDAKKEDEAVRRRKRLRGAASPRFQPDDCSALLRSPAAGTAALSASRRIAGAFDRAVGRTNSDLRNALCTTTQRSWYRNSTILYRSRGAVAAAQHLHRDG